MPDTSKFSAHLWGNFDKLLLGFFILYFSHVAFEALSHGPTYAAFVAAMLDNNKTLIGTLLGLMTGRALGRLEERNAQKLPPVVNGPEKNG